jgi:hypothetical protein
MSPRISKRTEKIARNFTLILLFQIIDSAMAQAVSRWPLTADSRVRGRDCPCWICSGRSGTQTDIYPTRTATTMFKIKLFKKFEKQKRIKFALQLVKADLCVGCYWLTVTFTLCL